MSSVEQKWPDIVHRFEMEEGRVYGVKEHTTHQGYYRPFSVTVLPRGSKTSYLSIKLPISLSPVDFYSILISPIELAIHKLIQTERIEVPNRRVWSLGTFARFDYPNGVYVLDENEEYDITRISDISLTPGYFTNNLDKLLRESFRQKFNFLTSTHMVLEEGFVATQNSIHFPIAVAAAISAGVDNEFMMQNLPVKILQSILAQEIDLNKTT